MNLSRFLEDGRAAVEVGLARWLPAPPACPALIADAMRYSLTAGGKRMRPLLALAAADAVSSEPATAAHSPALPVACALEMIHTYSLIHDDLPAMDDDALRRGRPTSHVVYGEGVAILAGDGLQAEAFRLIAREPAADAFAVRKLQALVVVAEAAGAEGMVGGQTLDLAADPSHRTSESAPLAAGPLDLPALRDMHAKKTGALIRASVVAGAIMAGAPPVRLAALERFGREIGLAFQIVDDILDVEGASADLGKTAGKDAAAGKPTYVSLLGLEPARALAREQLAAALDALADAGAAESRLADLARWVVERRT